MYMNNILVKGISVQIENRLIGHICLVCLEPS